MKRAIIGACAAAIAFVALAVSPTTVEAQAGLSLDAQQRLRAYHATQAVTLSLLGTTAILGSIQLYNMPTPLSRGACARGEAVFGSFACKHRLSLVHAGLGALSVGSFIANSVLGGNLPDRNRSGTERTIHDTLTVATAVGFGVTAVIGLIAANAGDYDLQSVLRIVHASVALLTAGAFTTQVAMEHIE
jgi:hypothetical protein